MAILVVKHALIAERAIDLLAGVLEATAHWIEFGRADPASALGRLITRNGDWRNGRQCQDEDAVKVRHVVVLLLRVFMVDF